MNLNETMMEGKIIDTFEIYLKKNLMMNNEIIIVKNNNEYFSMEDETLSKIKYINIKGLKKLNYYYFNNEELFILDKEFNSDYFNQIAYKKTFILEDLKEKFIILYIEDKRLTFSINKEKENISLRENISTPEEFKKNFKHDILNENIVVIKNYRSIDYKLRSILVDVAKKVSKNNNLSSYIEEMDNYYIVSNLKKNILNISSEKEKDEKELFLLEDDFFSSEEINLNLKEVALLNFEKTENKIYFYLKEYDRYVTHSCSFQEFKEISKYHREAISQKIKTEIL